MTDYPLDTLACTIDANGITGPSYADILLSLIAQYQAIYGSDVVLDADTQDGQWLAIQARAIFDCNDVSMATFNQFSPTYAQGLGLSSIVKINGIARLVPSNSTADVTIVGQAGTTITNGTIGDNASLNTQWVLPAEVIVPGGGSIVVTAICVTNGAVTADADTLTVILTPTAGWQTVTNAANAAPGSPTETDADLRRRQALSTQLPSQTILGGIVGALSDLSGVTHLMPYENDTGSTDGNGLPEHSICISILGGTLQDIVDIIGSRKTIGCNTYGGGTGATSGNYVDPISGINYTINFNIPTLKLILVTINIVAGTGYSSTIGDEIKAAIVAAINDSAIGQDVQYTRLYVPALLSGPYATPSLPTNNSTYELTSILISISPAAPAAADAVIAFNQLAYTATGSITLNVS